MPRLEDALTLATLFRVMVTHACGMARPGATFTAQTRWLLQENRWQAKRYGAQGAFALDDEGATSTAEQWLERASRRFRTTAANMGEPAVFDHALALLRRGSSAVDQLRCFAERLGQRRGCACRPTGDRRPPARPEPWRPLIGCPRTPTEHSP